MTALRLLLIVVATSVACSSNEPVVGACMATADCTRGQRCVASQCQDRTATRCLVDDDCGPGAICSERVCFGGTWCASVADCGPGERCDATRALCIVASCDTYGLCPNHGTCDFSRSICGAATVCASDDECLAPMGVCDGGFCAPDCRHFGCALEDERCNDKVGRCEAAAPAPCTTDAACGAPNRICDQGACVPGCDSGGPSCTGNTSCNSATGRCVSSTPAGCSPGTCSFYESCSPSTGLCEPRSCGSAADCFAPTGRCDNGSCVAGCGTTGCSTGQTCTYQTGECELTTSGGGGSGGGGGSSGLGTPCASNAQCSTTHQCHAPYGQTGFCRSLCGTSSDCTSGAACLESGGVIGVKACIPGTAGSLSAGSSCTQSAQCASGLCAGSSAQGQCFESCVKDAHCPAGSRCSAVGSSSAGFTQVCLPNVPSATDDYPSPCSAACASAFCTEPPALNSMPEYCFKGCCRASDCGAGNICLPMNPFFTPDLFPPGSTTMDTNAPQSVSTVLGCYPAFLPGGTGAVGTRTTCVGDDIDGDGFPDPVEFGASGTCRSNLCLSLNASSLPTAAYCTDTCCSDSDCGAGFACVSFDLGSTAFGLCAKI